MTDFRALCAELAAELDHNRQCLMDDRSLTHPLADRARAALAEPVDAPAAPPAEIGYLLFELRAQSELQRVKGYGAGADALTRAAELLERQAVTEESSATAPAPAVDVTAPHIRRMCDIILGSAFGNEELDSLALLVGHHPDVLNASPVPVEGEVAELVAWLRENAEYSDYQFEPEDAVMFRRIAELVELVPDLLELAPQLETERMRLAVCGVVAMSDTPESAAKARDCNPDYWSASADDIARQIDELMRLRARMERHAAPVPKLALAPANDYKSRWLEEDGVMKPVINWIHTIPIEDKDIFHCAQSSCWCSPKVDKDNPEIILHQALTSAQDGWVLIGEIEAASEKPDSVASPPPSELIAELIPELRKVAEHLRDCNFRGFSNYVARAAELLHQPAPLPLPAPQGGEVEP